MDLLLIGGMAIITLLTRYLPFLLADVIPRRWITAPGLSYISTAMLSAIITKAVLGNAALSELTLTNPLLLAAATSLASSLLGLPGWLSCLLGLLVFGLGH